MPPAAPTIELPHGAQLPLLGLGTWPLDDSEAEHVVAEALELGYRLVDTAENYGNEVGVGRGLRASGIPREEVFVTTKLNAEWHGVREVREAFDRSAERLGLDYIDLFLIHWPNPDQDRYVEAFIGLLELQREGLIRAPGVSNFTEEHLERVIGETDVAPDVNQIELYPEISRAEERAYHADHGIVTESWSPLGKGGALLREPVLTEIAERHGRTPAQIVLRWHVQLGAVPVPKSSSRARLEQNLSVFDFELSAEELERISALDRGKPLSLHPESFGH